MIQPTIGRKVWYWPSGSEGLNSFASDQPFDATVVYVWSPTCVNLSIRDHGGNTQARSSVTLVQEEDGRSLDSMRGSGQACWMPYQLGQARAAQQGA